MDKLVYTLIVGASLCSCPLLLAQAAGNASETSLSDARDHLVEIDRYIAERKASFAISGKKFGIFGRPQDPKKAKAAREQTLKVAKAKAKPKPTISLQRIVDALPVTLIDPVHDRVVLNGAPPLQVGETLELAFEGQKVMLRFEGARSNGAYFREMKSKKLGLRRMTRMPKGIARGNGKAAASDAIRKIDLNKTRTIKLDLNGMANSP